jgi:hypothetical protein
MLYNLMVFSYFNSSSFLFFCFTASVPYFQSGEDTGFPQVGLSGTKGSPINFDGGHLPAALIISLAAVCNLLSF